MYVAPKSVSRPGGINSHLITRGRGEIDLRTGRAADPVALLHLDAVDEIEVIQIVEQPLGIGRDLEHPLAFHPAYHLAAAALAHTACGLFIGKHALAGGAPVDGHLLLIGQAFFEQLEENPLRPFVIGWVCRVDLAAPVKRKSEGLQLLLKVRHIVTRHDLWMDMVLNGVIFRWQAEGIPTHWIQDVIALQPLFARHDVERRIGARMADVQPLPRRVRKFHEAVEFRAVILILGMKNARLLPPVLPFLFHLFKIVVHVHVHPF